MLTWGNSGSKGGKCPDTSLYPSIRNKRRPKTPDRYPSHQYARLAFKHPTPAAPCRSLPPTPFLAARANHTAFKRAISSA